MRALPLLSGGFQAGAMALFLLIVVITPFRQSGGNVVFAADVYMLATVLNLAASVTSSRRGGVDFLVAFFFAFFIALPARAQINIGIFPWAARLGSAELALTFGLLSLSQLAYAVGQAISLRVPVQTAQDTNLSLPAAHFYAKWAWGIAFFSVLCGVAAGPEQLLTPRLAEGVRGAAEAEGLTQQMVFIARSTSLVAAVILLYLARFAPYPLLRRQMILSLLVFLPALLVINYPPALPRFVLFGSVIALSCIFYDYTRPLAKLVVTVVALFVLFYIFPFSKVIARGSFDALDFVGQMQSADFALYLLNVDFDAFMQTVSAIQYLERDLGDFRYGYNFLGVVLFFVPRAIWPGKPIDSGEIVSTSLGYWFTNVSCPLPAEAVLAFGIAGPIVIFAGLGWFVSRVELRAGFPGTGVSELPRFVLYSITMGFVIIILRGSINGVAPQFASGFLVFAVMMVARNYRVVWRLAR